MFLKQVNRRTKIIDFIKGREIVKFIGNDGNNKYGYHSRN